MNGGYSTANHEAHEAHEDLFNYFFTFVLFAPFVVLSLPGSVGDLA